jgi:hypothetical protein
MARKLRSVYRVLRDQGPVSGSRTILDVAKLRLSIFLKGSKKVVSLDGCHFDVGSLPNTTMKLELLKGSYEQPERNAARAFIQPDWSVVELGGCFGVVACITNKLLRHPKAHVVLEANPLVIPYLESNRAANGASFKILNAALAYGQETVTFSPWLDFWGNSIQQNGNQPPVTVKATQLGKILDDEELGKFALICDIEGQEYALVMHEAEALRRAELLIMELHPHMIGEEKVAALMSSLEKLGFREIDRSALVVVMAKG